MSPPPPPLLLPILILKLIFCGTQILPQHTLGSAGFHSKKPSSLARPTKLFYSLTSAYLSRFFPPCGP